MALCRIAAVALSSLVWLGAAPAGAAAQGKLWIVSGSGCPGVHFATLQPAVDAAQDGDVVLVRAGAAGAVSIQGKSITLVADGSGESVIGPVRIENVAAGQTVLLHGFTVGSEIAVRGCAGPVWIEDCAVRDLSSSMFTTSQPLMTVESCASVVLARCAVQGGPAGLILPDGAPGVLVRSSDVSCYDSTVSGGAGASSFGAYRPPGVGGYAFSVESGRVLISGSSLQGGDGGQGSCSLFTPAAGGPGGCALGVGSGARAWTVGTTLTGGQSGRGGKPPCGEQPRVPAVFGAESHIVLAARSRSFASVSPVLESTAAPATYRGAPEDRAWLYFSFGAQPLLLPPLFGTLAPQLPGALFPAGVIDPSGVLRTAHFIPPGVVAPGEAVVLYAQGLFLDERAVYIGAPFAWVILDEAHDPYDGCPPPR